jgi:hypothetical protein
VCVCTEQPGTPWFHLSVDACRRGLAALDISAHGVAALCAVGVRAERLTLGAVPSMTVPSRERTIDVGFLGGLDDRRGAVLAELAPALSRRRSELRLFRFDHPVGGHTPGLVFGREKYELLASTRVLLNIHRDRSADLPRDAEPAAYFEWARMVEAMASGCVVLTEPATGYEPLEPGVHFVEAAATDFAVALEALLGDEDRRSRVAHAAREAVTGPLALAVTLAPHLDRIESEVLPRLDDHVRTSRPTRGLWRLGASRVPPPTRLGAFKPYRHLQATAKRIALEESQALRRLDHVSCLLRHGELQHVLSSETPSYASAQPEVSVVVTLYDYEHLVGETLASVVASEDIAFEVVIVEDHSHDGSRRVAQRFLDDHADIPMLLLGKDANEGLAAARNSGFDVARAPLVMVVDADNLVDPLCLRRLADALGAHPEAGAAYGILADFGESRGLRSAIAWDPARLARANYIDAQAMLRREAWARLGGYRDDDVHVFGWEDWDLWLRLAVEGGCAVLVPEILGHYRVQTSSMISLTNLATEEAIASMRRRYPSLPWPAEPVIH